MPNPPSEPRSLAPFVPQLVRSWLADDPDATHRVVDGTLAFIDISGFTQLTEQLTARGKVGAEELTDVLDTLFTELLEAARRDGAYLVKWGGDAVLLLFDGADHAVRAARAAHRMRARLNRFDKVRTPSGAVRLRMAVGIHTGRLTFFLVGDPAVHRELIVGGPAATRTAQIQAAARADEIGLSPQIAAVLDPNCVDHSGPLALLIAQPALDEQPDTDPAPADGLDLAMVLPPTIREHLLAEYPPAEHRSVAVAFVRFSGTDELLARGGPGELAAALDRCVRIVQRATERHGVTFLESDIDRDGVKIMIVSGAPRSAGHDEDRLLRTAQQIIAASAPLPLQVGVHRGAVFTGVLGPPFCRTYSVKGDAVNLAARLAARARPGEVLTTLTTLAHASADFEHQLQPPIRVKGKSAPVETARLGLAVSERPEPSAAGGALVAREVELSALRAALRESTSGAGALVEVVGEAGIGKSRLVQALLSEVDSPSFVIVCDEYETATPYWPFRALLASVLGLPPGPREARTVPDPSALRDAVRVHDPTLLPWLPLLARIVDIEVPSTTEVDALDDQFRRAKLQEVAAQLLIAALPSPIVLVFEDVHLMDDASVQLLDRLRRDVHSRNWLIVVTRRDVTDGFHPEGAAVVSVRPAPLDSRAAAQVAQLMGATQTLPGSVIEALAARAGGNPLFLHGLLRAALDGAEVDALPDTVEALIVSQLDRLSAPDRTVLRYASVLGMRFGRSELRALLGDRDLPSRVEMTRRLGYFVRADGDSLLFAHQLVRDTAYETLPFRTRRSLHGSAGELLESQAAEPGEIAEVLSLHFWQAERADKVWHYARIGGARAAAKYAYVQAEELFARAVQMARRLPAVATHDLVAANVSLGDARFRIGRQREALEPYRAARRALRNDPVRAALLLRREAEIEYRLGRLSVGLGKLTRGLRLLGDTADDAHLAARSRIEGLYAVMRQEQGRYREALRWARRAEQHAQQSGDPAARAEALQAVLGSLTMLGDLSDTSFAQEAVALYEQMGDRAGQSRALNNLALFAWLDGRGLEALDMFRRAARLATEAGDTVKAAAAGYNVGDVLLRLGRLDEAQQLLSELLPVLRSVALEDFAAAATRALGATIALAGRMDEGGEMMRRARARLEELGEPAEVVETDAAIAWTQLEHGDAADAARVAASAASRAEELDAGWLLAWLLRLQGAALSDMGNTDEARALLGRALDLADRHCRIERGFVLAELARLSGRSGSGAETVFLAQRAEAAFDELGFVGSPRYPRSRTHELGIFDEQHRQRHVP